MDLGQPPVLPTIQLPEPLNLPRPVLEVPRAELPSYKPIVVPPSNLRPPPGVKGPESKEPPEKQKPPSPKPPQLPKEIRYMEIPGIDQPIPIPTNEVLATAGTTATVSVVAGLVATSIFKRVVSVMKPVIKKILTKKKKNAES